MPSRQNINAATAESVDKIAQTMEISLIVLKQNIHALNRDASRWYAAQRVRVKVIPSRSSVVFAIPDLLENILKNLDLLDLLVEQIVNKTFKALVDNSPSLQRRLHLRPMPYSHLKTLAAYRDKDGAHDFPGLSISTSKHYETRTPVQTFYGRGAAPNTKSCKVDINIRCPAVAGRMPKVGDRCRKMLVCQPPLKELRVHTNCCVAGSRFPGTGLLLRRSSLRTVISADGFTVGELLELTEKLAREHRLCPDAHEDLIDMEGFVGVQVCFEATVSLFLDDPVLVGSWTGDPEAEKTASRLQRLRAYSVERRSARARGNRIPSLRDFLTANDIL